MGYLEGGKTVQQLYYRGRRTPGLGLSWNSRGRLIRFLGVCVWLCGLTVRDEAGSELWD